MESLQFFVNAISGTLLSASDHLCDVLLELCLVGGRITKECVDGVNYHILQYRLIDGSCVTFLSGWLQSTDAAPDDGFAAAIVPVNSAEHLTEFAANDNLCKAVVAAVGALFAISTCIDHSPVDYDKNSATTRRFYATVQNKMHYAGHGHTAAELIVERADYKRLKNEK